MGEKVKVLFVLPDLSGGGAEKVTLDLISSLNKENFEVTLFLLRKAGAHLKLLTDDISVIYGMDNDKSIIRNSIQIIKELTKESKKVDVVVGALELKGHIYSTIAATIAGKPIIGWLHKHIGYYLSNLPTYKKLIYKLFTNLLYRKMKRVVTVSSEASESAKKEFPKFKEKIQYIYNPIDNEIILKESNKGLPEWFNSIQEKPIILGVGRLEHQKGFDILIKAFSMAKKKGDMGTLVIIGEGRDREKLSNLIARENLTNVFLPGFTNPYPVLKHADLFVLSSRYEGLPTVLLEALTLNKRIISSKCPAGPVEILKDGKYGTLVESENIELLSLEITKFLKEYSRNSLNKLQLETSVSRFSKINVSKKWEELLYKIGKGD
ncbi:glycosyltransferase [Rossellomorea marisflavi]|uniref:glycosyltransferase n=1 Tax=Rossellomorea marisflavi TaxID=189381 RepID=UPI002079E327|nr:glycosyltransferase [Rossellomorea marisflavi]USK91804.1 glycosyltransferase [Rossellomorea marisflavi]